MPKPVLRLDRQQVFIGEEGVGAVLAVGPVDLEESDDLREGGHGVVE
jgi:hypothetical protein